MDAFALEGGAAAAFRIVDAANEYIAEHRALGAGARRGERRRLSRCCSTSRRRCASPRILLLPVMPQSAAEILRRVGETRPARDVRLDDAAWRNDGERHDSQGRSPVAARRKPTSRSASEDTEARTRNESAQEHRVDESRSTPAAAGRAAGSRRARTAAAPAPRSRRGQDHDRRLHEGRAARREGADRREGAELAQAGEAERSTSGTEQRTLVAGIAEAYEPEQLVGRTIVMVFNLKPAKLMGIESNGMVLAASPDGGKPTLVGFDQEVPPGTRVR